MIINPTMIISSINLSIMLILLSSVFFFAKSYISKTNNLLVWQTEVMGNHTSSNFKTNFQASKVGPLTMKTLKISALLSFISLMLSLYLDFSTTKIIFSFWLNKTTTNISLNFSYDQYFMTFMTMALMVTWSMMEFSYYYMPKDPKNSAFFRLLMIFLLKMLILTCSNSLFLLFLGWEGVGFLSFLLISWWTSRKDASSSALEAVIYNRMGDIGLIVFMALSILLFNSWNLKEILFLPKKSNYLNFLLLGLMLAAAGKSAQFGLHPWLPAAMEGPTPVSALLHSSTMVVAGVFLLMRTSDMLLVKPTMQSMLLLLGGMTAMFAASTAIKQHDMKKMMAYSTTSQLGLMVTAMGMGYPLLAFFHICTHAFFKAMLFLCSGSIMHSLKDEQDLRKMGGLSLLLPMTSACLVLGSLALMGTPFLAGFYSKDLMLELTGASMMNTLGIVLSIMATLLTAVYSFRMIFFCFLTNPSTPPLSPMKEENKNLTKALLRLASGTILAGWFFSNFMFENPSLTIPSLMKNLPLTVTIMGTTSTMMTLIFLATFNTKKIFYENLTFQWFYVDILHSTSTLTSLLTSLLLSSRSLDRGWQEKMGPQGTAKMFTQLSKANQYTQSGLMKRYILSSTTLTLIMLLSMIMIKS